MEKLKFGLSSLTLNRDLMFNFAKCLFNNTKTTVLAPVAVAATNKINETQIVNNSNSSTNKPGFSDSNLTTPSEQEQIETKANIIAQEKYKQFVSEFLNSELALKTNNSESLPSIHRFLSVDELMDIKKNLCPETILFSHIFSVILKENIIKNSEVLIRKDFGFDEEKDSAEKIKKWKDAYKSVFKKLQEKGYLINEYVEKRGFNTNELWKITWDKKTIIDMI